MADQQGSAELLRRRYSWEFFLSHGGDDTEIAKRLKTALDPRRRSFSTSMTSAPDEWRAALEKALRSSLVYVFLIAPDRTRFTYAEEEMTIANAIYRANQQTRRIVPVYLYRRSVPPADEVPFGMARLSGLPLPDPDDLSTAREKLRAVLQGVKPIEAKRIATLDDWER
jgi:hypothetical protein